jgi:ATP-dependent Clp protease ATP-binding subunit ClpB
VVVHGLSPEHLAKIVDIQLERIRQRLAERRIELVLTPAATQHLVDIGYDPVYGARPLKRLLQREVETELGRSILGGTITERSRVTVDWDGGKLVFSSQPMAEAA